MLKTLKGKISTVYIGLVLLIIIIGSISGVNLYYLSKTINGLMTDNYKSIKAVNQMNDVLDRQNNSILVYMYQNKQDGIKQFNEESSAFYNWYNIEASNITENNENKYVNEIKKDYIEYSNEFSNLQSINSSDDQFYYYNIKIRPSYNKTKDILNNLLNVNEKAMFYKKDKATEYTEGSMYAVLVMTFFAAIFGFIVSLLFTNRFLNPMNELIDSIRKVREGDLEQRISIISNDELGKLSQEFNNMTKRLKQYEESQLGKIMNERNRTLSIVKSISDPLIVLDSDYRITLLNSAAESIFKIEENSAVGKHILSVIRDDGLFEKIATAVENNDKRSDTIKQTKCGEKYYDVTISTIEDSMSQVSDVILVFHNITEFKKLDRERSDFISTISHEFKTPLTSIMMGTSLMLDKRIGDLNEKQKDTLMAIEEEGEKLTDLVNELLELTRLETGKKVYNFKPCSIFGIVENTIKPLYELSEQKDVNLHHDVSDTLPKVLADPEKVSWVINNLITNALKYTNAGDEIYVSANVKNGMMYVSVKDTGQGIPDEYKDKIFDRYFHTKDNDTFEVKGTGLGLAVVKEIVEAHGGKVWCESNLDAGSNFIFTLPIYTRMKEV